MNKSITAGSLWIGGEDNDIVEVLGNGHKPNLKAVRYLSQTARPFQWQGCEFVANRIRSRHEAIIDQADKLRALIQSQPHDFWSQVALIRKAAEASNQHTK